MGFRVEKGERVAYGASRSCYLKVTTFLAFIFVLFSSCEDTHILSGSFISGDIVAGEAQEAPDSNQEEVFLFEWPKDLSLELVLGHYGPEVAGLAKFRFSNRGDSCPCVKIENGTFSSGLFTFRLKGVDFGKECGLMGTFDIMGSLYLIKDSTLDGFERGYLEVTDSNKRRFTFHTTFRRLKFQDDLNSFDLSCEGFKEGE